MKGEFNFDLHALKRIDYIGVTFRTRTPEEVREIVGHARRPVAGGRGRHALAADLQDLQARRHREALSVMRANQHFGKIVISVVSMIEK